MTDKELNAAVQAAFAANPEAKQFHVIATGYCFTNELDARHAARQLGEHERGVRVVTRDGVKGTTSEAAPVEGAPVVGDGASVDADGDGGAGSINTEDEPAKEAVPVKAAAAKAAPKKSAKKK